MHFIKTAKHTKETFLFLNPSLMFLET